MAVNLTTDDLFMMLGMKEAELIKLRLQVADLEARLAAVSTIERENDVGITTGT